jgi:hypothetical protein
MFQWYCGYIEVERLYPLSTRFMRKNLQSSLTLIPVNFESKITCSFLEGFLAIRQEWHTECLKGNQVNLYRKLVREDKVLVILGTCI